ncbi:MAG TPA: hypothetical protein VJM11_10925 [Nevskiaceae bacterium]|nr:hypothetical protein [Nevskiaceae bacterium]
MKINVDVERSTLVAVPRAKADVLLKDLEATLKRFPKLKKLSKLGENEFRHDMQTIGSRVAKIAHDVSYGAKYVVDPSKGQITFKPLPKVGNAQVEGGLSLVEEGNKVRVSFRVKGELNDVPVPLVYRLVAPAFIQGKFTALVDAFLQKTAASLTGGSAA